MLVLLVVACAGLVVATDSANCDKFCDLFDNGTAYPEEWCSCFGGVVSRDGRDLVKALRRVRKEKEDKDKNKNKPGPRHEERQGTGARSLREVGSVFQPALTLCTDAQQNWGSFNRTLFSTSPGFFSVRDQGLCGDVYLVYDGATLLGATSNPGCTDPIACQNLQNAWTGAVDDAPCISRGCFYMAPNVVHQITVVFGFSPYQGAPASFDVGYYAEAPGADCSQSNLLGGALGPNDDMTLRQCTPTPPVTGANPCNTLLQLPTPNGCPTFLVE